MSLFSRDPILLTPGPITTSLATKTAMLRDWGSWDADFNAFTAEVRRKLLDIVHGHDTHVCVPMQGSGTFSVEAAVNTLVPRDGHVLVLINGAYGTRMAKLVKMMGRRLSTFETAEDVPTTPADVDRLLRADPSITHVGLIHCETSTGILNPLPEIAAVVSRGGRPDLAGSSLPLVRAPTLLLVGSLDGPVIGLNRQAYAALTVPKELVIVAAGMFSQCLRIVPYTSRKSVDRYGLPTVCE